MGARGHMVAVRIEHDEPVSWAHKHWEEYGFDYDTARSSFGTLYCWALNEDGSDRDLDKRMQEDLARSLREDGYDAEVFECDLDKWFDLDVHDTEVEPLRPEARS